MRISDWSSDVCSSDLTVAAGAQFAHRFEYARRVEQARVEFATVDMQAAPRLADDGGRRGHRGVAAFDRLRAVDQAPHRLVLDPGFDEAFADRNEAVARLDRKSTRLNTCHECATRMP